MSLVDNANSTVYATAFPIDKIVDVWEGSFNKATETIIRSGSFGDIYVYRIAHGFTRPVFVDLLWSDDNITWVDGGVAATAIGDVSLAFSDSTYIYIIGSLFAPGVGTRYYKAIGFWIDTYDATNPLVPGFLSSNKQINFDSRLNYQKIYRQNVLTFGSATTQTVTHGLGRRPNFRVFFEAFSGEVWPMNSGGASNPFDYDVNQTECHSRMNNTGLDITLDTVPASRRVWYRIYLDSQ